MHRSLPAVLCRVRLAALKTTVSKKLMLRSKQGLSPKSSCTVCTYRDYCFRCGDCDLPGIRRQVPKEHFPIRPKMLITFCTTPTSPVTSNLISLYISRTVFFDLSIDCVSVSLGFHESYLRSIARWCVGASTSSAIDTHRQRL
jgi:hypothetical protein